MLGRMTRLALLAAVLAAVVLPLTASAAPTDTIRVSTGIPNTRIWNGSLQPVVNDDGSLIVFTTRTMPGNDYSRYNVMLHRVATNTTTLLSATPSGTPPAYRDSRDVAISGDGSTAAFASDAALVAGAPDLVQEIYLRSIATGAMSGVSVSTGGAWGNNSSSRPFLSANGRYVVFASTASNLVAGDTNGLTDIFVRDTVAGTTVRVSVSSGGGQANAYSVDPAISRDGRYVAFASTATNLVSGDTNKTGDIFVHDLVTRRTVRASVSTGGTQGNGTSVAPSLSSNGRYVSFTSASYNLVPGDTNTFKDIFVRDMQLGRTTRVSVSSYEKQAGGASWHSSLSGDGRYVAFTTSASNLVPTDANKARLDVLMRDRTAGTTWRASVSGGGQQGNGEEQRPRLSSTGVYVVFQSESSNLVTGDTNQVTDIFRRRAQIRPAAVTLKTNDSAISYGAKVTLSGTLYGSTAPLSGRTVWLQSSTNQQTWRNVTSRVTASNGAFIFTIKPTSSLYYKVVYGGGNGLGPGTSPNIRQWVSGH